MTEILAIVGAALAVAFLWAFGRFVRNTSQEIRRRDEAAKAFRRQYYERQHRK